MKTSVLVFLVIWVLAACGKEAVEQQKLIDSFYKSKVDAYLNKERAKCYDEIRVDAEVKIDSMIDTWVSAKLKDSLNFPNKPIKPNAVEHVIGKVVRDQ